MYTHYESFLNWSTSSACLGANTLLMDVNALGQHLSYCKTRNNHLYAIKFIANDVHGFVVGRLLTSLIVTVLLIGVALIVL